MKKILFISYFFEPCNAVSVPRFYSWACHFFDKGVFPIILTRNWDGTECDMDSYTAQNLSLEKTIDFPTYSVSYIPFKKRRKYFFYKYKIIKKILSWLDLFFGNFDMPLNANPFFYNKSVELLTKNKIDAILVSVFSLNSLKLACSLSKKFKIPLIVDFRDGWLNNDILKRDKKWTIKENVVKLLTEFYIRKWTKNAKLITFTSIGLKNKYLERIHCNIKCKYEVIYNGYNLCLDEKFLYDKKQESEFFEISLIGTVYLRQDLKPLFTAIKLFLEKFPNDKLKINFVGLGIIKEVEEFLKSLINDKRILITNRLPAQEVEKYYLSSNLLIKVGLCDFEGWVMAKTFEYLISGNTIVICPNDNQSTRVIFKDCQGVHEFNNSQVCLTFFENFYSKWLTDKTKVRFNRKQELSRYSRKEQAYHFATLIHSIE